MNGNNVKAVSKRNNNRAHATIDQVSPLQPELLPFPACLCFCLCTGVYSMVLAPVKKAYYNVDVDVDVDVAWRLLLLQSPLLHEIAAFVQSETKPI